MSLIPIDCFPPDGGVHGGDEEGGGAVQLGPQEDSHGEGEEPLAQENAEQHTSVQV